MGSDETPELEKDTHQSEVHRGVNVPEFTPRAIIAGVLLGMLIMSQNVYLGLKTGTTEAGSILAAILCFAMFRAVRLKLSPLENNIAQSLSTAAGSIGIIASAVPALSMLGYTIAPWQMFIWLFSIACLGIFFAIPLRRQLIVGEALRFPTGTACAETITAMHAHGDQAGKKARVLGLTALIAGIATWFRDGVPSVIPSLVFPPLNVGKYAAGQLSMGLYLSPMLLSVGVLVGVRIGISLLIGGLISWVLLGPLLAEWGLIGEYGGSTVRDWMMWPAISLMIASGFTSLALRGGMIRRSIRSMGEITSESDASRDLSRSWWWFGLLVSAFAVVLCLRYILGIPAWIGAVSVFFAFILAVVAMRAYGETDVSPVGTMGHSNQIMAGMLYPGHQVSNLGAGSVAAGSSDIAASLMQVLKTGHLLGATPRKQIFAQLIGALIGAVTAVFVLGILTQAHPIGSDELPAPGAYPWKGVAELLAGGTRALPAHALLAVIAGACTGIALTLLAKTRAGQLLPSPFGLGIGLILPGFYSLTIFAGSLAGMAVEKRFEKWSGTYLVPLASGGIAGEAIMGVLIALLIVIGILEG